MSKKIFQKAEGFEAMEIKLVRRIKDGSEYLNTLIPKNGDIFVDVGAGRGETCKNCKDYCNRTKIIAIEPNPDNVAVLRNVLKDSQHLIIQRGVWDKKEDKILYSIDPHRGRFHSYGQNGEAMFKIKADTLDSILNEHNINCVDLIKIDTEGAEVQALGGFTKFRKGTKFHIECHNNLYDVLSLLLEKVAIINRITIFSNYENEKLAQILGEF